MCSDKSMTTRSIFFNQEDPVKTCVYLFTCVVLFEFENCTWMVREVLTNTSGEKHKNTPTVKLYHK